MLVKLTHPFIWHCKDIDYLLDDCFKLNTFLSRVEKKADELWAPHPFDSELDKATKLTQINNYKGHAFELLTEAIIRLFPCDKRICLIKDYRVVTEQDVGVDGVGVCGYNKKPITVQCKSRHHDHVLEANKDSLTNFTSASMLHYGVDQNPDKDTGKCNMIIFTSGDSINFFTDVKMFGEKVHALCRNDLRKLLDDNMNFWEYFKASWVQSLSELKNG